MKLKNFKQTPRPYNQFLKKCFIRKIDHQKLDPSASDKKSTRYLSLTALFIKIQEFMRTHK